MGLDYRLPSKGTFGYPKYNLLLFQSPFSSARLSVACVKTRARGSAVYKLSCADERDFFPCFPRLRMEAQGATPVMPRPRCLRYTAHSLSSSSPQTSAPFLFPFFPATGQVHRRRAPAPGDTALESVPAGSRWRLHMSIATIMDGLTLRKQRNSFVLLFKPMSVFSADTKQPSLIGVYKPTSVYISYLQARGGECTARRIPNTTVLLR